MSEPRATDWRTPALVIVAGCLVAMLGFGPRSVLGLSDGGVVRERDRKHDGCVTGPCGAAGLGPTGRDQKADRGDRGKER